ncbi:hypothetical protein CHLRE_02g092800v5 [Chlamydomonas reinhardtii]|uniref:Uncharacterized protein n=1 Tax=Chlamydomonas reinhardtii TaxID=3055 RepID=A8I9F3_CHLRE|nr:uncharacterized protein CHLRE_02g092800v5 [Chlamydomonas reinhardtii]PNW86587.1 hypothetical protein CHLRE_02g092800v5 [Chlamydomonas reinhardtii]|eukprot:XP_001701987.1 flagellar associated protein [Chlamydomonas reinhardtii]
MASTSGRDNLDDITSEDIALFRRSLLARRFPGLKDMSEGDLIALIRAERKATGRKLVAEPRSSPKTNFTPPPPKREQATQKIPPFVPANPHEAKEQAARAGTERFINVNTPYEAHREEFNTARTTDESKRVAPFVPSCATQARENIAVKYYLNSPMDSEPTGNTARQTSRPEAGSGSAPQSKGDT